MKKSSPNRQETPHPVHIDVIPQNEEPSALPAPKDVSKWSTFMRVFNFTRAVALSGYSIYAAIIALQNPLYTSYSSEPLFIVTIIALSLDIIFTVLRTFPQILEGTTKSMNFSAVAASAGVWGLIIDRQLIMDMLTPMINGILKVYSYRFTELLSNTNSTAAISYGAFSGNVQTDLSNTINDQSKINLILLALFGLTLLYIIIYHSIRIGASFAKRGSTLFAFILVFKALLLIFNVLTGALFLYQSLLPRRLDMFRSEFYTNLTLAVIVPSSIVSLLSNSFVNFPLHFCYLRVIDSEKISKKGGGRAASTSEVFKDAIYNTFLSPTSALLFGGYAVFSTVATFYIIEHIGGNRYAIGSDWSVNGVLWFLVWINTLANCVPGSIAFAGFIVLRTMMFITGNGCGRKQQQKRVSPVVNGDEGGCMSTPLEKAPLLEV